MFRNTFLLFPHLAGVKHHPLATLTALKQKCRITSKWYLTSVWCEQHCVSSVPRGLILSVLTDSSCNPILWYGNHPQSLLDARVAHTSTSHNKTCSASYKKMLMLDLTCPPSGLRTPRVVTKSCVFPKKEEKHTLMGKLTYKAECLIPPLCF